MIGLLFELIISWLLLWAFEKKNLVALGIRPAKDRLANLFFGFLISATCCTLYYLSFTIAVNNHWELNDAFSTQAFASGAWWTFRSVLFEELIFRGALLYILLARLGTTKACVISAVSFGVYHWFTMGAFGNPGQMIILFVVTGIWGFMFAMAFAKTKSLYLPVALHFGWNLLNTVVFSEGPLGQQLLILRGDEKAGNILSLLFYLFQVFAVPLFACWYIKRSTQKK